MSNNNKKKKELFQKERFEKFIEDNRASSKKYWDDYCERNRNYYAEGLLAGESANGGVPDEIVALSRKKAREFLKEIGEL